MKGERALFNAAQSLVAGLDSGFLLPLNDMGLPFNSKNVPERDYFRALSNDLRTKILEHYEFIPEATYFCVGEASVSRLVRHFRETGNVAHFSADPYQLTG